MQYNTLKILFISSGNSEKGISPIVKSQGESLRNAGINVDYFTIVGKGLKGYLKNILPLRRYLKKNNYDIIHAHYSLSAFVATLAGSKPLIVSLMGSDIRLSFIFKVAIKVSSLFFWHCLIVKSKDMQDNLGIKKTVIIPNGVNTSIFKPVEKKGALEKMDWGRPQKHLLFAANSSNPVKNFQLLQKAYQMLGSVINLKIHALENIPHQEIQKYMNAADVVILTSLWEGSPNVIKEAMACNCPTVATDVGDIAWLFGETPGYYLCSFDPVDVAAKINMALKFSEKNGRTEGRDKIIELGLDSETIARRIISVYESVLEKNAK